MKKVHAIIQSLRVFNVIIIFLLVHTFFLLILSSGTLKFFKDVVPIQQSICLFEEYLVPVWYQYCSVRTPRVRLSTSSSSRIISSISSEKITHHSQQFLVAALN